MMSQLREARNLWHLMSAAQASGHKVCMAMITAVTGSAYRRPGAKMMMASDGQMAGTLSGGCLEGDIFAHAQDLMNTKESMLCHYDLIEEDMWGLGIGCKGAIDVWVAAIDVAHPFWQAFGRLLEEDAPFVLGVELNGPERFLQAGSVITTFSGSPLPSVVSVGEGQTVVREGWVLDHLTPPQKVVVTGAGHDVKPLVALAQQAGFEVSVLDPRRMFNNPQVFPQAVEWVNQDAQHVDAERWPHAYWVIMNHHQDRDEHCLDLALRSQPRYVGVLGPLSRTQEMLRRINRQFEPHVAFFPVGLDVGAETPEEVAISIVSEMMAVRAKRTPDHLKGREKIHGQ